MKTKTEYLGKVSITCNGKWDETKKYERLCLVYDDSLNSYVSRKKVPAKTSLDNEEYWQPIASLAADVLIEIKESLEQTLVELVDSASNEIKEYFENKITEVQQELLESLKEFVTSEVKQAVDQYISDLIKDDMDRIKSELLEELKSYVPVLPSDDYEFVVTKKNLPEGYEYVIYKDSDGNNQKVYNSDNEPIIVKQQ